MQGNHKLHKDIDDLETAYMIHKHYVDKDENSVKGLIRFVFFYIKLIVLK